MIHFEDVTFTVSGHKLLRNINLSITENRVGIVGANGSGKSTLVKLIKGFIHPSQGKISVLGHYTQGAPKNWHLKIGFIFQDPEHQIILPLVEDDIAFGLKNLKLSKEEIRNKTNNVLKRFGLEELKEQTTYHLSGGQKQLLAIAGVLVMEPNLVLFDEPTTLLDLRNRNRIYNLIYELSKPIIVVTHDLDLLKGFDRVIVLENGSIVADTIPGKALEYYVESMA